MAVIRPLRGIRYNPQKIDNFRDVITPPYDVIDEELLKLYRFRSPYNFVHIDLPNSRGVDGKDRYYQASRLFDEWLEKGIFLRDDRPSFYYYELNFKKPSDPRSYVRKGFITLLRLEDIGGGCVYPHEKTFSRVKQDRLNLMRSTNAQLSPIFALYSDPEGIVEEIFEASKKSNPIISFTDDYEMEHNLWKVTSPEVQKVVMNFFTEKEIFIADGHHRYETALAFRNEMRKANVSLYDGKQPYDYCLMYLSAMEHPGLTILPTHRMFVEFPVENFENFLSEARNFFDLFSYSFNDVGISEFKKRLEYLGNQRVNAFGHIIQGKDTIFLLVSKKEQVENYLKQKGVEKEFFDIDVVILDNLILRELYKFPEALLEDEKVVHFCHDTIKAFDSFIDGKYKSVFFINPTRIDQVRRVASACLIMPHKSTYFYPKVLSGLVIYKMDEYECNP